MLNQSSLTVSTSAPFLWKSMKTELSRTKQTDTHQTKKRSLQLNCKGWGSGGKNRHGTNERIWSLIGHRVNKYSSSPVKPFDAHCCHMGTRLSVGVPGCQKLQMTVNPVWYRMLYSCTHMETVGVNGLNDEKNFYCGVRSSNDLSRRPTMYAPVQSGPVP